MKKVLLNKDFWLSVWGKINNMWCRKNTQMYILDVSFPVSWEIDVMETNLKIAIMIFHWAASERCLRHIYPVLHVIWYEQKCMLCTVGPVILNSTYCIWNTTWLRFSQICSDCNSSLWFFLLVQSRHREKLQHGDRTVKSWFCFL